MTKQDNVTLDVPIGKIATLQVPSELTQESRAAQVVRGLRTRLKRQFTRTQQQDRDANHLIPLLTAPLTDISANLLIKRWSTQYWAAEEISRQQMLVRLLETQQSLSAGAEQIRLFFRRLYAYSDSLLPLVRLRADLLSWRKKNPELSILEKELKTLLVSWFDVGMLELQPITWDSPASLLEKLIEYEAVHEINSWLELKHRLTGNRRCYAYFHPRMPNVPLIFVEIALTREMADNVQNLLDPDLADTDLDKAKCANFYSISNTQLGLRGISFGNFLLKRVVEALSQDYPQLRYFVTLSPIPGFTNWLAEQHGDDLQGILGDKAERRAAKDDPDAGKKWVRRLCEAAEEEKNDAVQRNGMRLVSYYLLTLDQGQLLDPVARFHLGNGARLERLNWAADTSDKGVEQSCGWMANYRYELSQLDANLVALAAGKPKSKISYRWR